MKNTAFTLAEVIITLGLIGIIAAMTMPSLINRIQNIKLESQFKKGHSILANAVKMQITDNGYNGKFTHKDFMKYFPGATNCGSTAEVAADSENCMIRQQNIDGAQKITNKDKHYRNFAKSNKEISTINLDDGQFYILGGPLIMFDTNHEESIISIDTNGKKSGPNIWGQDLFTFQLRTSTDKGDYELTPMGAPGTYYTSKNTYCSKTSSNAENGIACAYYAVTEPDFFKNLNR